ncbi:MAG TPA: hypothetical protein VFT29_05760 [Gemmatimonadaceae bacterium]|nr:hypothetical protein [Gemmatimonadaceae bacterium]
MQGFLSELSDLGVVLALICVPLATGAVFIPLGKAIAARIRHRDEPAPEHGSHQSDSLAERIGRLESLVASIAKETQRMGVQQHFLARLLDEQSKVTRGLPPPGAEGRVVTPH